MTLNIHIIGEVLNNKYYSMSRGQNPNGSKIVTLKGTGIETVILECDLIEKVEKLRETNKN